MEIVIKISDEDYEYLKTHNKHGLYSSILNGTPLPKGHGRLVDEKQVVVALVHCGFLKDNVKCGDITKILDIAKIIEADNEKSDKVTYGYCVYHELECDYDGQCVNCPHNTKEDIEWFKQDEEKAESENKV